MIVITGGAGFIGSNLVKTLNERGRTDILVVDDLEAGDKFKNLADLRISDYMDHQEFRSRLDQGKLGITPDFILHQGAFSDPVKTDGRLMIENNFGDSKAILHYCLLHKVPMAYGSSAAVYGASKSTVAAPANERPTSLFGYSKLVFDQHVRSMLPHTHSPVVGLRYFNVYGAREQHKGSMMSVVSRLLSQLKAEGVCRLHPSADGMGDGEQTGDFIHVSDIVEVNLHFVGGDLKKGIFNVGSGETHSHNEIARHLIRLLGQGRIDYLPAAESLLGGPPSFPAADIRGLRESGFSAPFKSLEDGIAATLKEWTN